MLASGDPAEVRNAPRSNLAGDIVELLIFTVDEAFLQTLRDAVGNARRLWHVLSADKVSDLLLAGQVGILVLDVHALPENAGVFITQIKRQFPDLVLLVAGARDAEMSLANLISAGVVHRFIHKPVSPGRATAFVEAAVKKYGERRSRAPAAASTQGVGSGNRRLLIGTAIALVAAVVVTSWAAIHRRSAREARSQVAHIASSTESSSPARAGLAEAQERLWARAESALLEERLDEATEAIDAARAAGIDDARIALLMRQLAKSREQFKSAMARGASARAQSKNDTRQAAADASQATRLLSLAEARLKEGSLIDPDGDSALFYVQQALRIDPGGNATQAAQQTVAIALLADARGAIDRREYARATSLLDAAGGIAAATNVENARQLLRAARSRDDADAWDRLLKAGQERLRQDRLIEPATDSAKYYLLALQNVNPGNPGLAPALNDLGLRLVANARRALDLKQYDAARTWLSEAAVIGYSSAGSGAMSQELQAAETRQRFLGNIVPANALEPLKSVKPPYPPQAEQSGTEGWVELDFTVAESGDVQDVAVHAAEPVGVFDAAAIGALSQWRFRPFLKDGKPAAQRSRIRIRFALPALQKPGRGPATRNTRSGS